MPKSTVVDLYRDDFSGLTDQDVYRAIEEFTRIAELPDARPHESFVLDFKEKWGDRALQSVAGFAHTFGGLLLIGVSETDTRPEKLIGVECSGELKTSIASSIATNISPVPSYEIVECRVPATPTRKLAVVRVRQGSQLHYLTKKGEQPIYVRNEDESRPADAAQLRSLIERKTQPSSRAQMDIVNRLTALKDSVRLLQMESGSVTNLQIRLVPDGHPGLTLDSSIEQQFRKLVTRSLAGLIFGNDLPRCDQQENRDVGFYELRHFRPRDKHENVVRLTSGGDIGFATQVRVKSESAGLQWSLGNTMAELWFILALARSFWRQTASFFGEAQVAITLSVGDLQFKPEATMSLWPEPASADYHRQNNFDSDLGHSIMSFSPTNVTVATATGIFNSARPNKEVSELIANLSNQLLRGLGHSADLQTLRNASDILLSV
jgi:hypothetical protein